MKINTNPKKLASQQAEIEEILNRWADKIYPSKEEFLKAVNKDFSQGFNFLKNSRPGSATSCPPNI